MKKLNAKIPGLTIMVKTLSEENVIGVYMKEYNKDKVHVDVLECRAQLSETSVLNTFTYYVLDNEIPKEIEQIDIIMYRHRTKRAVWRNGQPKAEVAIEVQGFIQNGTMRTVQRFRTTEPKNARDEVHCATLTRGENGEWYFEKK